MANLITSLSISGDGIDEVFNFDTQYNQVFDIKQELDNADSFISLLAFDPTVRSAASLPHPNYICVQNPSPQPIEVRFRYQGIDDGSTDVAATSDNGNISSILRQNEYIVLPSNLAANYVNSSASACNGSDLNKDNAVPSSNMYEALGTTVANGLDNTTNPVTFNATDGDFIKVGDLLRCENEILEVTNVATNAITVSRGMNGSTAASHADSTALRLPFFNNHVDFDKHSVVQTDLSGRYAATNFMGFGRNNGTETSAGFDGFVRGTFAIKFYQGGYQEIGLSGITSSTESGLAASTAYAFDIAVDGGSDYTLSFTTSTNTKFGGSDGVIRKIQDALDAGFYASGNLFEKRVTVAIVDGDIRFTSGQNLSTSTISITAPASGTTPFGVGRLPAVGDVEDAVAATLPTDTITKDGISVKNYSAFLFDDGFGNLVGNGSGTIDYDSGAITLQNCPPNAEMVFSVIGLSGVGCGTSAANVLDQINARSLNAKRNANIRLIGFN